MAPAPVSNDVDEDEAAVGMGAATPAVFAPNPNFCNVSASSFPEGFKPCADWNFFIASTVEASHFPFGLFAKDPSVANAC